MKLGQHGTRAVLGRQVYQTYVDTKQLSRLMWLESTATDQVPSVALIL